MNNKISKLLNIEEFSGISSNQEEKESVSKKEENQEIVIEQIKKKNIKEKLENLEKDIFSNKKEIEDLLDLAINDYKKMMYIAYSSEPKIAGNIFEPAVELLKTVLEKKSVFIDQKLQLYKLNLLQEKISKENGEEDAAHENMMKIDRNKLLKILKKDENK